MGFIGDLFGASGLGFQAQGATPEQVAQSISQNQGTIAQQQAFLNAIQAAGGKIPQMQADLASQLAAQSRGEGPNIAAAQLAETTAANVARQAALMASQRGAATSPGTIARLAAQQGAQAQQTAVGQAATMRAQQQLAAQAALAGLTGQMMSQRQAGISGLGSLTGEQQRQLLASQAEQNRINAEIALAKAGMQSKAVGGALGSAGQVALMSMGVPAPAAGAMASTYNPQMIETNLAAGHGASQYEAAMAGAHTPNFSNGGMVDDPYLPAMRNGPQNTGSILGDYAFSKSFADGGIVPGKAQYG